MEAQTEEISTDILTKAASNAFNAHVPPSFASMACRNETLAQEILKHQEVRIPETNLATCNTFEWILDITSACAYDLPDAFCYNFSLIFLKHI